VTIIVGYWLYVVHNWLYIAKYGAKSVYKTDGVSHGQAYLEQEHSFQRRRRELAAIELFFSIWFGWYWLLLIWWSFCFKGFKSRICNPSRWLVGKNGISNVGLRILNVSNLIDAHEKKIHQLWVSKLFLTCALDMVRFPCSSTPDGRGKQGW